MAGERCMIKIMILFMKDSYIKISMFAMGQSFTKIHHKFVIRACIIMEIGLDIVNYMIVKEILLEWVVG